MQLDKILRKEFINGDLSAGKKTEVLEELSNTIIKGGLKLDLPSLVNALQDRENLGSTGIGQGVALPHARISEIDHIILSFGRSKTGVEYGALDEKPVHIFFLLLIPENSADDHLKALAKISKMLKIENFRNSLLTAQSPEDLYRIIIEQETALNVQTQHE